MREACRKSPIFRGEIQRSWRIRSATLKPFPKGGGRVPVAEVFLLKNACADAALLFLAARFHGVRAKGARIAAGAAVGALCALISLAAGGAMLSLPAKAAVCAGMVFIATGKRKLPAVCASVWTGALLAGGANRMGLSWLTAGFVSGATLCALRIRRSAPAPGEAKLSLVHDGKETRVPAIYDSGCRAIDPGTLLPVIVVPAGAAPPREGARAIWVQTAAGRARLACVEPEAVLINGIPVSACVAAAPEGTLRYALIPPALAAGRRSR